MVGNIIPKSATKLTSNIKALIVRIGFGGTLYYNHTKLPSELCCRFWSQSPKIRLSGVAPLTKAGVLDAYPHRKAPNYSTLKGNRIDPLKEPLTGSARKVRVFLGRDLGWPKT